MSMGFSLHRFGSVLTIGYRILLPTTVLNEFKERARMYNNLYFTRTRRGWTQRQLAAFAGVSRGTICSLERTGRIPSVSVGVRLCRALDCSFEEVFPVGLLL